MHRLHYKYNCCDSAELLARAIWQTKEVLHNSCNMGTCGLLDIHNLSPSVSGVHIRQTIRAHVTTIICN